MSTNTYHQIMQDITNNETLIDFINAEIPNTANDIWLDLSDQYQFNISYDGKTIVDPEQNVVNVNDVKAAITNILGCA